MPPTSYPSPVEPHPEELVALDLDLATRLGKELQARIDAGLPDVQSIHNFLQLLSGYCNVRDRAIGNGPYSGPKGH